MKVTHKPGHYIIVLFFGCLSLCSAPSYAVTDVCKEAKELVNTIETYHYSPRSVNNNFSIHVFNSFLKSIDSYGLLLNEEDVAELKVYRQKIDNEVVSGECEFFGKVVELFKTRRQAYDSLARSYLSEPFDLYQNETFSIAHPDSIYFPANERERHERVRLWLKYKTLSYLRSVADSFSKLDEAGITKLLKLEPKARDLILKKTEARTKRYFDRKGGVEASLAIDYLNAICSYFDPHTNYFSITEMEEFTASLSSEGGSYGIEIDDDQNGNVEITNIIPGSSAWKSGKLNKGDVLIKVQWPDGSAFDLTFSSRREVTSLMNSSGFDNMKLTIKKKSGIVNTVSLKKETLQLDDNVLKSFVLKGDKKVGYLSLPGFYTQWEDEEGTSCADDVAKEIIKINREKIDGLIIDLRYNGGGSLQEAVELSGIFIDAGPIFIETSKDEKPFLLKDYNRGAAYTGPLVILVNSFSASASELFSAAMQDYERGVVVGSSTYGKSTGQNILPLGLSSGKEPTSFVKVTLSKYYRVTGETHQLNGVEPDVTLPDLSALFDMSEATEKFALPNDTIDKEVLYVPNETINTTALQLASDTRLKQDKNFTTLQKISPQLKGLLASGNQTVNLNILAYQKIVKADGEVWKELAEIMEVKSDLFTAKSSEYDFELFLMDDYAQELNTELIEEIEHDIYIDQAYQVILDILNTEP